MNKEIPSFTKQHGNQGAERKESAYKKKSPDREHPFKNTGPGAGYRNVGNTAKNPSEYPTKGLGEERKESSYKRKDPYRNHPHQGK